jgi:hypothetical protein
MDKEKHKQNMKRWKDNNKQRIKEYNQEYNNKSDKNKIKQQHKKWNEINKEKISSQFNQRYNSDNTFKLARGIKALVYSSFKTSGIKKNTRTLDVLGCSIKEFKQHIESQFEPWMNWKNKGIRKVTGPNQCWDIDHIIPISSAKTEEDIIRLNHYTNLRPLCSYINRWIKKDKF